MHWYLYILSTLLSVVFHFLMRLISLKCHFFPVVNALYALPFLVLQLLLFYPSSIFFFPFKKKRFKFLLNFKISFFFFNNEQELVTNHILNQRNAKDRCWYLQGLERQTYI